MSSSVRSSRIATAGSGSALSITAPAGTATGDLMLIFVNVNNGMATVSDNNGATAFTRDVNAAVGGTGGCLFTLFSRRIVGGDPGTYNFTGSASDRWVVVAVAIQSPHASVIYDVASNNFNGAGSSVTTGNSNSITTLNANAIHFCGIFPDGSLNAITGTPATYTVAQNGGNEPIAVCHKVITSPSATGTQSFTWTSANVYGSFSLAIRDEGVAAAVIAPHINMAGQAVHRASYW